MSPCAGLRNKECDRRLPSQKQSKGGQENNMNQSRTLYVSAVAGYVTESDLMPLFDKLVELFVEIEEQKYIVVDGTRYENVLIKVLIVADMMFLHKIHGAWRLLCFNYEFLYVLQLHEQISS